MVPGSLSTTNKAYNLIQKKLQYNQVTSSLRKGPEKEML